MKISIYRNSWESCMISSLLSSAHPAQNWSGELHKAVRRINSSRLYKFNPKAKCCLGVFLCKTFSYSYWASPRNMKSYHDGIYFHGKLY